MSAGRATAAAPDFAKAKVAASKLFQLFDRKSSVDYTDGSGMKLVSVFFDRHSGLITFIAATRASLTSSCYYLNICSKVVEGTFSFLTLHFAILLGLLLRFFATYQSRSHLENGWLWWAPAARAKVLLCLWWNVSTIHLLAKW